MESLQYNIDFNRFKEDGQREYWIEGWCLGLENRTTDLFVTDGRGNTISCKIELKERPDVMKALGQQGESKKIGFSILIPDLCEGYSVGQIVVSIRQAAGQTVIFQRDVAAIRKDYKKSCLRLNIDRVKKSESEIQILGWATDASGKSEVRLATKSGESIPWTVTKRERRDIAELYHIKNLKCAYGFQAAVKIDKLPKRDVVIKLIEDDEAAEVILAKREFRTNVGESVRSKLTAIKNIPSKARYIKKHGYARYCQKKERENNPEYPDYTTWLAEHCATDSELKYQRKQSGEICLNVQICMIKSKEIASEIEEVSFSQQSYPFFEIRSDGKPMNWDGVYSFVQSGMVEENQWTLLIGENLLPERDLLFWMASCAKEHPEADLIYSDHDSGRPGDRAAKPYLKPDFNQELLRNWNYIGECCLIRNSILKKILEIGKIEGFHDLFLKASEQTKSFFHVAKILYHTIKEVQEESLLFIENHLKRSGLPAIVETGVCEGIYEVKYQLTNYPLISILIPNKDHKQDLQNCLRSILEKTTYPCYEILIGENNSETEEIFVYYEELKRKYKNIRICVWPDEFNYSAINNMLVRECHGEYVVLLNNDVAVITPQWLENMLGFAQRKDVGAVGAKLYYPDDTVQHAGVILGMGGIAGHVLTGSARDAAGYLYRLVTSQEATVVTAACMMVRKSNYEIAGQFEEELKVAFNDVDFCMKIRNMGLKVIFSPQIELYHYESKSRGQEDTPEKVERFGKEIKFFENRWKKELEEGDPFYNSNLTLQKNDCSLKNYDEEKADGKFYE